MMKSMIMNVAGLLRHLPRGDGGVMSIQSDVGGYTWVLMKPKAFFEWFGGEEYAFDMGSEDFFANVNAERDGVIYKAYLGQGGVDRLGKML